MEKTLKEKMIGLLIIFLLVSTLAFAAKDFDVRNNSNSFLFVNGSTGKVGIKLNISNTGY